MLNTHQNDVLDNCFEMGTKGWRYIFHFHDGFSQSSNGGTQTLNILRVSIVELLERVKTKDFLDDETLGDNGCTGSAHFDLGIAQKHITYNCFQKTAYLLIDRCDYFDICFL